MEAKSKKIEDLDKRLKDLDAIMDLVNTLEDAFLEQLGLPPRDNYIYSLCMLKKTELLSR